MANDDTAAFAAGVATSEAAVCVPAPVTSADGARPWHVPERPRDAYEVAW
ncbi:MAG: hypothetical protein RLZZ383_1973 [Pseudomonadota bacterium]|jgi:hypothetical protein